MTSQMIGFTGAALAEALNRADDAATRALSTNPRSASAYDVKSHVPAYRTGDDYRGELLPAIAAAETVMTLIGRCQGRRRAYSLGKDYGHFWGELLMPRRTFFSFHYVPDVWRAWNVRNCWVVKPEDQEDRGFFDSSVFEASKKESDDALKAFLRKGLENTSVTCVLTGTNTWGRRWVRYEIARSVIKGNGLLTVHIHGVKNKDGQIATKGADPLAQMGLYRANGKVYLAEWKIDRWVKYDDYTLAISEGDLWFGAPETNNVVQLSQHCLSYDFSAQDGRKNIDGWIETAAGLAGR
jgi:hypothetical protein